MAERTISLVHASQTLADYATLDRMTSHVGMGYNSLMIGQRIGLTRAGVVVDSWPVDNTGWPWSQDRAKSGAGIARAVREDSRGGYRRHPESSTGLVVSTGRLMDVIEEVAAASEADPEATIVVAGQCHFDAHRH